MVSKLGTEHTFNELKDLNVVDGTQVYHVHQTVIRKGSQALIRLSDHQGNFMCYVLLHDLKGTQGEGVADAENLKVLSSEHKFAIQKILDDGEDEYLTTDLFQIIELKLGEVDRNYNFNSWKRTISELLHWDCFVLDLTTATYRINTEHCEKLFESGEFVHYK